MNSKLKVYLPFIKSGLQQAITYRINFFFYRFGDIMGVFVSIYLWKAVFSSQNNSAINSFNINEMIFYLIISYLTNLLIKSNSSFMLGEEVKDGSISMRLLKPVNFILTYLFTEIGEKTMLIVSLGIPVLLTMIYLQISIFGIKWQVILHILMYLISTIIAYLINFYFNICFGFSAFVFKNLWGSNLLKNTLVSFLSGSLLPISFFPKKVISIFYVLPFSSMVYSPVMIFLNKYNTMQGVFFIFIQILWLYFFIFLSKVIFKNVKNHLTIQGG